MSAIILIDDDEKTRRAHLCSTWVLSKDALHHATIHTQSLAGDVGRLW
jgi:hypothetical protein